MNATPDSFSDGGRFLDPEAALSHARRLIVDGADLLDIGGESTRPGAQPVAEAVEIERVVPLIRALAAGSSTPISIDTMKPAVARAAILAGATLWNDVTALGWAPDSLSTAAALGCDVVLMHMRGSPMTMQSAPHYDDVVSEVRDFLTARAEAAVAAGVHRDRIWLDPGIGFGKTVDHNLALLHALDRIVDLGFPVLLGASRKSFISRLDPRSPTAADRLGGSLAVALAGARAGVAAVRVHDVRETVQGADHSGRNRRMTARPSLGRVLIIAGSDSGGGAGIQGDIKTVTALGGYAATAITSLTVQNTLGVHAVHPVPVEVVIAQARAVLDDIGADAIKTGMLGERPVVEAVARLLAEASEIPVVIDPVMVAKGGASLLAHDAVEAVRSLLIGRADLLTPNASEAEVLTGLTVRTTDDLRRAGEVLLALGARAVLMKGGHVEGETVTDVLMTQAGETTFSGPRVQTRNTHGTGCTLASACATGLAQGLSLEASVARAWAYVAEAIRTAPDFGAGAGPLNHAWPLNRET